MRVGRISTTLHFDAIDLRILIWLYLKKCFCQGFIWCIVTSAFVICLFFSFFWQACTGSMASVSGDGYVLSVKNGMLLSIVSRLRRRIEHYNVFAILHDSGWI